MTVTNSTQSAGERREIVVEILAQAVLDLILDGGASTRMERRPEPLGRAAARRPTRLPTEAAHAAG